ncbi:MAG TPA: hypothetical protein VGN65_08855, partial [Casimicrobiaceae bacterium]
TRGIYLLIPSNNVRPTISFTLSGRGTYNYHYHLSNAANSLLPIERLDVPVAHPGAGPDPTVEPPEGFTTAQDPVDDQLVIRMQAIPRRTILMRSNLIPAGGAVDFSIGSSALAGIGKVQVFGTHPDISCNAGVCATIDGENEETIRSAELEQEAKPLLDLSAEVWTAVPAIPAASSSVVVSVIKKEIATWPDKRQASLAFVARANPRLDKLKATLAANRDDDAAAQIAGFKALIRSTAAGDLSEAGRSVLVFDLDRLGYRKRSSKR